MAAPQRPALPTKKHSMRPPLPRPFGNRTLSSASILTGRISPADSITSSTSSLPRSPAHNGVKRKEREFDRDAGEETNINVVVRCRGRNERELRENSGVVVSTDGLKGKTVELSMGPSAVSNKTYQFDKVFSPAADQSVVFDEVVAPILDEVLGGFNCTIFAYGQTGTGKTYTMSGDITDVLPLPDSSGIIPRVLRSLFDKLETGEAENSVKCSFIELYNEELRDLLAADETAKLKIYDDANRKSTGATLVQGMEESHIKSASKGLELLRLGSLKRQVAATKCNDLSSRSHTVFTITVYMKRTSDTGEEFVSVGKLNLVDLAGSENIQRSGAENKRAAEAGLINKSLLTLGRVINALVEKGSHIPYRESKLTRLLQDSLGGRTKTCIIATLSPAKSNLEETISTLDYAFRAKNIRNKPQINQMISKKTLIKEFTAEIEKLKGELIATRHRNGVYLTSESYEELTTESESRRILSEEQRDKIETMELNLRNKAQELFALTSSLSSLKKDNEATRLVLEGTMSVLEKTEIVLEHTRQNLAEEKLLRKAYQDTEEKLIDVGHGFLSTLGKTTSDIEGLRLKIARNSDVQSVNQINWTTLQTQVSETTQLVEQRINVFEAIQQHAVVDVSSRMQAFVKEELASVEQSRTSLEENSAAFQKSEGEVNDQTSKACDEMNEVLEEIKTLRQDVKQRVGEGLDGLSAATQRISAGVIAELEGFHTQLHSSYSSLGRDFKTAFDDLVKHLHRQQAEAEELRHQLSETANALVKANDTAAAKLDAMMAEEKQRGAEDRSHLISHITSLIQTFGETQERRLEIKFDVMRGDMIESKAVFSQKQESNNEAMNAWSAREASLIGDIHKSRESVKSKIKQDWNVANEHNVSIQATTRSVHEDTERLVDAQMKHMDVQLQALDEIVSRVRAQNGRLHDAHFQSLKGLTTTVKQSYSSIGNHLSHSSDRTQGLGKDITAHIATLSASIASLTQEVHVPLADLRSEVMAVPLTEYTPTGQTPQKTKYEYTTTLPRTEDHGILLARLRAASAGPPTSPARSITRPPSSRPMSPSKPMVFTDPDTPTDTISPETASSRESPIPSRKTISARPASAAGGLRELDVNLAPLGGAAAAGTNEMLRPKSSHDNRQQQQPPLKRQNTGAGILVGGSEGKEVFSASVGVGVGSKLPKKAVTEGRENVPMGAGVGPGGGGGREGRGRQS